jgi:tetratricopeptide (TPR) repeat protein
MASVVTVFRRSSATRCRVTTRGRPLRRVPFERHARVGARLLGPLLVAAGLSGCAGHAGRTEGARTALDAMQPKEALEQLNEELDVDSANELPTDLGGDNALLILDRAMVLQQLGDYELSSRDLEAADKQVEVLDLSRNAAHDLGKYLFSDDVGPYKAPAYEKLMINTMNMVNYLVRGDLNGARIEARRLAVMQKYLRDHEDQGASLLGPGSYLAGFTFEKSGQAQEALRYYDEALQYGSYRTLTEPIRRLAAQASYRTPRIREALGEAEPAAGIQPAGGTQPAPPDASPDATAGEPKESPPTDGELLVVVSFGRVPAKIAERIPIGLALTYVSGALSPNDMARANYLAAQGLVTWVNYPRLGKPRGQYDQPDFAVDGESESIEPALAVDREAIKAWDQAKGAVIASAITRMITRAVAGEAVRRGSGGGTLGALLSIGTQLTMTVADTPDTRSWATLPARMAIGRVHLPAGTHQVKLRARGYLRRYTVTLKPGGFAVLDLTVLS